MKVIDNFLPLDQFKKIQSTITGFSFPWFYNDYVNDEDDDEENFQFTHLFYSKLRNSDFFSLLEPLIKKLNMDSIARIKANLLVKTKTKQVFNFHNDFDWKYKWNTAIFYINTNNGKTIFKHNNKQITSRENRVVIFDGRLKHAGTTCTDSKNRIVINLNYFNNEL
jgi:hypothetical protein|tara:strand:+ start:934 stop:1431 length:498 start_codon:yes stop_codon:yes gene_type:complete